jgi:2-oxoglutarate ferredoxin oxidoreductase subunit alpha
MIDHYAAKIESAIDEITLVKEDLDEGADILVVSYGIVSRSAAVAIREARSRGRKVSSLVLQTLWPVPEKRIASAMAGVKKVVVPEMNMGQYLVEIERLAPPEVEVVGVCKMDTTLVSPAEILERGGLA